MRRPTQGYRLVSSPASIGSTEMRTTVPSAFVKSVDALFLQQELETLGVPGVPSSWSIPRCRPLVRWRAALGDDNGTYFPRLGDEANAAGLIRSTMIGSASRQLMESVPFVDFTKLRLEALLAEEA